jgi:Secretion system C-terminal sorting domain
MRIILTTIFSVLGVLTAIAQVPYTITSDEFPVWGTQNFDIVEAPNTQNLAPATNGEWDLSTYHSGIPTADYYVAETDPAFTNLGIDVYIANGKNLNANLGYSVFYEFDFNELGVFESAIYVPEQTFPLTNFTGNNTDNIHFPLQGSFFDGGRQVMKFPATYQTNWQSVSHRVVDFDLTVAAAGLVNTPCQHLFTCFRTDTIVGWGKMQVHIDGQASLPYDVLINKNTQYFVDSFYVGGAPAPADLLTAFGITQGQILFPTNRYTVYRSGFSTPFAIFTHLNGTFQNPDFTLIDTENLFTVGTDNEANNDFSVLLFPNPTKTNEINLQFYGAAPSLTQYEILDMLGRVVQTGTTELQSDTLQISCPDLQPGQYILHAQNDKKQIQITQQFSIGE